jgi:hypothetical protein
LDTLSPKVDVFPSLLHHQKEAKQGTLTRGTDSLDHCFKLKVMSILKTKNSTMMQRRSSLTSIVLVALVLLLTCNGVRSFQVVVPRSLGTPRVPSHTATVTTTATAALSRSTCLAVASTSDNNSEKPPETADDSSVSLKEGAIKVALGIVALLVVYNFFSFILTATATLATSAATAVGNELFSELGRAGAFLLQLLAAIVGATWEGLQYIVPVVGKGVLAAGQAAAPVVEDATRTVMETASPLVQDASRQLSTAAAPYLESASQAIDSSVGAALRDASASVGSAVDATIQDASQAMTSAVDMTIVTPLRDAVDVPLSALKGATDGVTSTFQGIADGAASSVQSVLPFKAF